jgi:hypothetical protein
MDTLIKAFAESGSGPLTWCCGLALFSVAIFRWADSSEFNPQMQGRIRPVVRDWLLSRDPIRLAFSVGIFLKLFDSLFSAQIFSRRRLFSVAISSLLVYTIVGIIVVTWGFWFKQALFYSDLDFIQASSLIGSGPVARSHQVERFAIGASEIKIEALPLFICMFVLFGLVNVVGDFFSVIQTRFFLSFMDRNLYLSAFLFLSDWMITLLIWMSSVIFFGVLYEMLLASIVRDFYAPHLAYDKVVIWSADLFTWNIAIASLMSTFIVSIWLLMVIVGGPATKALSSLLKSVRWMSKIFNVDEKPIITIGNIVAILLLFTGIVLSIVEVVLTAII